MSKRIKVNFSVSTYSWKQKGNAKKGFSYYKVVQPTYRWSEDAHFESFNEDAVKYLMEVFQDSIEDMKKGNVFKYQVSITLSSLGGTMKAMPEIVSMLETSDWEGAWKDQIENVRCYDGKSSTVPCDICGGIGWYIKDGSPKTCERYMPHLDKGLHKYLFSISGVEDLGRKTFDNFIWDADNLPSEYKVGHRNSLQDALQEAQRFAEEPEGWLVFQGRYGVWQDSSCIGDSR